MLASEKTVEGGFSGKKPWRGVFALAVQASGWMVVGNAGSAGPDSRDGLLCQPWAHTTPDCARLVTQSWSPRPGYPSPYWDFSGRPQLLSETLKPESPLFPHPPFPIHRLQDAL